MKNFFLTLIKNAVAVFSKKYLPYHGLAAGITFILVMSGFDWRYFSFFHDTLVYNTLFPAVIIGGLVPVIVPACMFVIGFMRKNSTIIRNAQVLTQAAILGSAVSSLYKSITGRVPPDFGQTTLVDTSRIFHWSIFDGGIFWGWPSSHTTIAFAMAVAIFVLYRNKKWIAWLAITYATYIGLGVSMSIHWFSDFLAGAIFGTIIGIVVGNSFRNNNQ